MACLILTGISAMRLSSAYMLYGVCTGKDRESTIDSARGGQNCTLLMCSLCLETNDVLENNNCAKASRALLMGSQLAELVLLPKLALPKGSSRIIIPEKDFLIWIGYPQTPYPD
eukprot:6083413-Ditylum_brightwellii.AAC.1